jgi:hypothetical protein
MEGQMPPPPSKLRLSQQAVHHKTWGMSIDVELFIEFGDVHLHIVSLYQFNAFSSAKYQIHLSDTHYCLLLYIAVLLI